LGSFLTGRLVFFFFRDFFYPFFFGVVPKTAGGTGAAAGVGAGRFVAAGFCCIWDLGKKKIAVLRRSRWDFFSVGGCRGKVPRGPAQKSTRIRVTPRRKKQNKIKKKKTPPPKKKKTKKKKKHKTKSRVFFLPGFYQGPT